MDLKLNRKSQLPIHVQLKAQVAHLIQAGQIAPGAQLPTVRQVAGFLRVNRNTVSKVFAELERDGYLSCEPGRGTFVAPARLEAKQGEKMRALLAVVDEAMGRAGQLGFSSEEFAAALYARAQTGANTGQARKAPMLLVECNRPQLKLFTGQLETELPAVVTPLLIRDLGERAARSLDWLAPYRAVVTTLPHVQEVKGVLRRAAIPVVGLLMEASIRALLRLTELPTGTPVGLTCLSQEGSQNLLRSVQRAGLTNLRPVLAPADDPKKLPSRLRGVKAVVCSILAEGKVRRAAPPGTEVIVDDQALERGGIELLREILARPVR